MKDLAKAKTRLISILSVVIICLIFVQPLLINDESSLNHIKPNRRQLEYKLPPGYTVGTFQDYINDKPYAPAEITCQNDPSIKRGSLERKVSLLIKTSLYPRIKTDVDQYSNDLEREGYTILSVDTLTGGNPEEVKQWVQSQYASGAIGVVFIGDIPAAWAEVSDSTFPCDLFYMDLDGSWSDSDNDGVYESHSKGSGDMGPEVYVGRLFATSLNWNTEDHMISEYFDKVHSYRSGALSIPKIGLEYVDEDWYNMDISLDEVYQHNVSRYDFGYQTTAEDYLNQLQKGQHFVQVCAHSYPGGHHFGRRPTEAVTYNHIYVHSPIEQEAKLLVGCDDEIIAWLNGDEVLHKTFHTRWLADRYKVDVTLDEGWNSLLCKVGQENGDYLLSTRFTDPSYQTIPNLTYALDNPQTESEDASFIRGWLIHGFHQDSSENFYEYLSTNYLGVAENSVVPYEGQLMNDKKWTRLSSSSPYIDLNEYGNNPDYGVTYAFMTITSDEDIDCEVWIGYDDGLKAWLNNDQIVFDNRYGGYSVDMKKIPIHLNAGENHLLLKISEWMGGHGFSARICDSEGGSIDGIVFGPEPDPISYIGTWLIAGPYENKDEDTRLTTEYISNEKDVRPSEGDMVPEGMWQKAYGDGYPFDIARFFDTGGWVFSQTIQDIDPPVFFYNLFSCGPGRFTDENYLAGSYIFNTTYGLITIASSKSGSMLQFHDFYRPLGMGKSFGESFIDWFTAQAPFDLWEKEWYYGMVLCGDPTLSVFQSETTLPQIEITRPDSGIYVSDKEILPFFTPIVIGNITVNVDITNPGHGISNVSFYLNNNHMYTDTDYPFSIVCDQPMFGKQSIQVVAVDVSGQESRDELIFWKIF